jgi:hypothetical protein
MKKEEPELVERYVMEAQKGLHKMSLSVKSLMFSANPFKAPAPGPATPAQSDSRTPSRS